MQPNDSYRLVVRRGPQPNQSYELTKDVTTLGRDITNDIVINDREVSRHHMRLTRGSEGFSLEDLGSTNGTFVNGKRLTGIQPLRNGDIVGLGETVTLVYELARGPVAAAGPMPSSQTQPGAVQPQEPQQPEPAQQPSPYEPPRAQPQQEQQPQQPAQQPSPYEAPQPQYNAPQPSYEQQQPGYEQPQQEQPYYAPQQGYGAPPGPPVSGYDYDPYAMREDEGGGTMRWILIGCVVILLACCCISVIGLIIIDSRCLWGDIPVLNSIMQALGFLPTDLEAYKQACLGLM